MHTMTTTEHLEKIKAKCLSLLAIAKNRTIGQWQLLAGTDRQRIRAAHHGTVATVNTDWVDAFCAAEQHINAAFIASCAGPAEAGWRATILAIDWLDGMTPQVRSAMEAEIITAWPEELLSIEIVPEEVTQRAAIYSACGRPFMDGLEQMNRDKP